MSDVHFPSGQWVGFYMYPGRSERFLMDLVLEFRDGVMTGEGWDNIGLFDIDGRYSTKNLECSWKKMYYQKHTVQYTGYGAKKGIWGTWTIQQLAYYPNGTPVPLTSKGGFHIWPIGERAALEKIRAEIREAIPQPASPLLVPHLE